jgi:hypothetical protein
MRYRIYVAVIHEIFLIILFGAYCTVLREQLRDLADRMLNSVEFK